MHTFILVLNLLGRSFAVLAPLSAAAGLLMVVYGNAIYNGGDVIKAGIAMFFVALWFFLMTFAIAWAAVKVEQWQAEDASEHYDRMFPSDKTPMQQKVYNEARRVLELECDDFAWEIVHNRMWTGASDAQCEQWLAFLSEMNASLRS